MSTALATKARAICGRSSAGRRHVGLEAERIEDDDQAFEFDGERIELLVERREQFGLPSDPGSNISLRRFGHGVAPSVTAGNPNKPNEILYKSDQKVNL